MQNRCLYKILHDGFAKQAWTFIHIQYPVVNKSEFKNDLDIYDEWFLTQFEYTESEYLEPFKIALN